jgi:hypothetical protein
MGFPNSIDVFVMMDVVESPLSRSLLAILAGRHSLLLGSYVWGAWSIDQIYDQSEIHLQALFKLQI